MPPRAALTFPCAVIVIAGALEDDRGAEDDAPEWHAIAEAMMMALGMAALVAYWLLTGNSKEGQRGEGVQKKKGDSTKGADGSSVAAVGDKGVMIRTAKNRKDETIGGSLLGSELSIEGED